MGEDAPEEEAPEVSPEPLNGADVEMTLDEARAPTKEEVLASLDPPRTGSEHFRDKILRTLDSVYFQYAGLVVLIGVIASGAVFFFFLMGWQTLCRPRTDCEPRNRIYNISIQVLNVFFTYMATISMPWRCANFMHTVGWHCPHRTNDPGYDLYGLRSNDVWFHVDRTRRTVILVVLLLNCIFQYLNQATRFVFYNYYKQDEIPGNIWTNVFFGASMICAAIGGLLLGRFTGRVRDTDPELFGPGPIEIAKEWMEKIRDSIRPKKDEDGPAQEPPTDSDQRETVHSLPDLTRPNKRVSVTRINRGNMRLWAM